MLTNSLRAMPAALVAGVLVTAGLAGTADAVDDTKPLACGAMTLKDGKADQTHTAVPEADRTGSTEILGGFMKYDAAKGDDATTYNIVVSDLKASVPTGWTTISWSAYYQVPGEEEGNYNFVRSIVDFTGATVFEHGRFIGRPDPAVPLTGASVYDGTTTGKLFEGKDGVIQIVVPGSLVKSGMALTGLHISSGQGRTAPTASPPHSRGLSHVLDQAPDDSPEGGTGKWTVAACDGAAAPPAGSTGGGSTGGGGAPPAAAPPTSSTAALPVTLAKGTVKAPKSKRLKLALKSSEAVTSVGARLRKGSKAVGTGKIARISGKGTLTLKLKGKLKKGSYVLDLAGNAASGERRVTSLQLKVR